MCILPDCFSLNFLKNLSEKEMNLSQSGVRGNEPPLDPPQCDMVLGAIPRLAIFLLKNGQLVALL